MAYDIGTAFITIVPSFRGLERRIKEELGDKLDGVARKAGEKEFPEGFTEGAKQVEKSARRVAERVGGAFRTSLHRSVEQALQSLEKVEIGADSSDAQRALAQVRNDLTGLIRDVKNGVGDNELLHSVDQLIGRFRELERSAPGVQDLVDFNRARVSLDEFRDGILRVSREVHGFGDDVEGAFGRRWRDGVRRVLRDLPDDGTGPLADLRRELFDLTLPEMRLDTSQVLDALGNLRDEFRELSDDPNVSRALQVNADAAAQGIDRIFDSLRTTTEREEARFADEQAELLRRTVERNRQLLIRSMQDEARVRQRARAERDRELNRIQNNYRAGLVRATQELARQQQQLLTRSVEEQERAAKEAARRAEEAFGRTWAGRVRQNLERAVAALPDIEFKPARNATEAVVADLRRELDALRQQRIGIDVDTGTALRQIEHLQSRLAELARTTPDVRVQADAVAAAAQLRAVQHLAERLDGETVEIRINEQGARAAGLSLDRVAEAGRLSLSHLEKIIFASISLGTTLVPAAAAAAGAIGFIGTAAAASASGIGVLVLGLSGIGDAVGALQDYEDEAAESAASVASAQNQVASAVDAVASAERSLENTRASNAAAARRAAQQVVDAQRGVVRAQADAARQIESAERALARAQVDARRAQVDLTRAREDARRALEDMAFDLEELSLAQQQATLDQAKAKEELDKIRSNPRATEEERRQAQITYEQAVLRLKQLGLQYERLSDDQKAAAKAGVNGSEQVTAAQQRVADTAERVADAQRQLAQARVDGDERVADAQRRVAEAVAAQQEQQRQAAFAISQAQQAIANAHRQVENAALSAGNAGGAALDNLNEAMSRLSPTGQRFARFLFGLRDEFDRLRAAAADNLLPGLQAAIETALPFLPDLEGWVGRTAEAIGRLSERTVQLVTGNPSWQRFWNYISSSTVPTLERLFRISSDAVTGLVNLFMAFTPFNDDVGGGLERLMGRFVRWSESLETNRSFQGFLAYVRENGPAVVDLIGELVTFVGRFIEAAAPTGAIVVRAFTLFTEALNAIPMPVLTLLVGLIALWSARLLAVATANRLAQLSGVSWNQTLQASQGIMAAGRAHIAQWAAGVNLANAATGRFTGSLYATNTAAGTVRGGLGGLAGFLGGPWGIAIAGATIVLGAFMQQAAEHDKGVQGLTLALRTLGDEFRDLAGQGRAAAATTDDALRAIVVNNPDLQQAVVALDSLGIGFQQLSAAAAGSERDMQAILSAIDQQISQLEDAENRIGFIVGGSRSNQEQLEQLRQVRDAIVENADALQLSADAQRILNGEQTTAAGLNFEWINHRGPATIEQYRNLRDEYLRNAERIRVLNDLVDTFGDTQSTAAEQADALRAAIENETSAQITAIEAEEAHARSLHDLSSSVQANGTSLEVNSAAGLRNRDALEEAAKATRDMFLADIEAGVAIDDATGKHQERIDTLVEEAKQLGLDEKAARALISTYGEIPENIKTAIETENFEKVYEELAQLQFAQFALEKGLDPKAAAALWKSQKQGGYAGNPSLYKADGGYISGPGTATSDSIPAWLSNGEFVQPAASVDYYGQGLMEALRRRLIPKDVLPGYAAGGLVAPFKVDLSGTFIPTLDEVLSKVVPQVSSGGIGSADMMRLLRSAFPGLAMYSGYRPGSRTASGSLSYHARTAADGDKGRAVDIPPRQDVFNWIHDRYMRETRELIWGGDPNRNVHNGRHHRYNDTLLSQHGPYRGRPGPSPHIHWAFDAGGMLPPGVSTVFNGTGKPEPVLTAQQWDEIEKIALSDGGPREVHNWNFREAVLDHGRLQAWADRRDARVRPGRRR